MKLHILNCNDKEYPKLLEFIDDTIIYRIGYIGLFNMFKYKDMEQAKLDKIL